MFKQYIILLTIQLVTSLTKYKNINKKNGY